MGGSAGSHRLRAWRGLPVWLPEGMRSCCGGQVLRSCRSLRNRTQPSNRMSEGSPESTIGKLASCQEGRERRRAWWWCIGLHHSDGTCAMRGEELFAGLLDGHTLFYVPDLVVGRVNTN